MSNSNLAPTSKTQIMAKPKTGTDVVEFRKVATPWVTFVAEQPNDIAGQNADPDGTLEDSVDISDPNYNENKTHVIEIQYAEEDHLEPPIYINTLDSSINQPSDIDNSKNQSSADQSAELKTTTEIIETDQTDLNGETLEDEPDNSDPSQAAALLDMSEIYEPKSDENKPQV